MTALNERDSWLQNNFLSNKSRVNKNHHYWGDKLLSISKKVISTMDLDKNW